MGRYSGYFALAVHYAGPHKDRHSHFGHVSALYTPLPSFRGTVKPNRLDLAAKPHLFAANLPGKRHSRTVHSSGVKRPPDDGGDGLCQRHRHEPNRA
jgi:hypothetical protein